MTNYPVEILDPDDDDGTMPNNVDTLAQSVVGHRIISVTQRNDTGLVIMLDDGTRVTLADTHDCCAGTELETFLLHADLIEHIITGVGTTDGYTTWHIYADAGDVMQMTVGWSCGNPFYYCYGFDINVLPAPSPEEFAAELGKLPYRIQEHP